MTLNKKWFILFLFTLQKFDTWHGQVTQDVTTADADVTI